MTRRGPDRHRGAVRRFLWLPIASAAGYVLYRVVRGLRPPRADMPARGRDAVGGLDHVTVAETITASVATDGTVIVDDVAVAVDDRGAVAAIDEMVAVETPDGTVLADEVVSVADEQGNLVSLPEETSIEPSDDRQ